MSRSSRNAPPRRWPWYAYLGLLALLSLAQLVRKIMADAGGPPSRFGGVFAVMLVFLYVTAWLDQKPLGKRLLWRAVFGLFSFIAACAAAFAIYLAAVGVPALAAGLGVGVSAFFPAIYALFDYVYRSDDIWDGD